MTTFYYCSINHQFGLQSNTSKDFEAMKALAENTLMDEPWFRSLFL